MTTEKDPREHEAISFFRRHLTELLGIPWQPFAREDIVWLLVQLDVAKMRQEGWRP